MGIKINRTGINSTLKSFISVFSDTINEVKDVFSTFVNNKKFELKFNAQAIYLSEYLNQVFDPISKRIYIVTDTTLFDQYFFRTSESILPEEQLYFFRTSESITEEEQVYFDKGGLSVGVNFQVLVPSALSSLVTNSLFLASVRKYKLPDKRFEVLTY